MGFAVGFSGVWVGVEDFVPLKNPYPRPWVGGFDGGLMGVETLLETSSTCRIAEISHHPETSVQSRFRGFDLQQRRHSNNDDSKDQVERGMGPPR